MKNFTKIIFATFLIISSYNINAQGLTKESTVSFEIDFDYDILIYPNPVTDNKFYVKSEKVIKSVEVMNILGQNIKTVYNETNVAYNIFVKLGEVKKGMYMVKVTFEGDKSIIRKIILK